jgi:hypothetical protein
LPGIEQQPHAMSSTEPPEEQITWNPASVVARGVAEGMSGNAIVRALQQAGMGVNRGTVFKMIGQVRAAIANREHVATMPTDQLPAARDYATWTTSREGFSTQLLVFTRDRETGIIGSQVSSYTTLDPHSPDEAIAAKQADWLDLTAQGSEYEDQQYLGAIPYNLFQMVTE